MRHSANIDRRRPSRHRPDDEQTNRHAEAKAETRQWCSQEVTSESQTRRVCCCRSMRCGTDDPSLPLLLHLPLLYLSPVSASSHSRSPPLALALSLSFSRIRARSEKVRHSDTHSHAVKEGKKDAKRASGKQKVGVTCCCSSSSISQRQSRCRIRANSVRRRRLRASAATTTATTAAKQQQQLPTFRRRVFKKESYQLQHRSVTTAAATNSNT